MDPAVPMQVKVNVEFAVITPVVSEPEVAFVPVHAPEAVHEDVFAEVQVSVEEFPDTTEVGLTINWMLGDELTLPPKLGL